MSRSSKADCPAEPDEARLKALLDAAVDGIVIIDRDGIVQDFNPGAQRMFGFRPEQIIGQNVSRLMPEPDRSRHDEYLARYLRTGVKRIIGTGRNVVGRRADGATFPVRLSVGDAGGRFVGILHDLSDRRVVEAENRRLYDRLAEMDRYNLMGEIAAGLAHELNQPLSAITTCAQAAERLVSRDDAHLGELREACRTISEQALRAGKIIRDLRYFVTGRESTVVAMDINRVIDDVLNLARADATAAGIPLSAEFEADLPAVVGEAAQVQQVLLNLTRNAVDAMNGGLQKEKGIQVCTERIGRRGVRVSVQDHGVGVPPELAGEMFQPFVSTKPGGLGVGLSISRRIARAHGGDLDYQSNPQGGSIFELTLPLKPAEG